MRPTLHRGRGGEGGKLENAGVHSIITYNIKLGGPGLVSCSLVNDFYGSATTTTTRGHYRRSFYTHYIIIIIIIIVYSNVLLVIKSFFFFVFFIGTLGSRAFGFSRRTYGTRTHAALNGNRSHRTVNFPVAPSPDTVPDDRTERAPADLGDSISPPPLHGTTLYIILTYSHSTLL